MKLQKTIFYSLLALLICSLAISLISRVYNNSILEIIFRSIFTGCVVGSITSLIIYFQNKSEVLNRLNEQLIETHKKLENTELFFVNLTKEIESEQNLTSQYLDWSVFRIEEFTKGFNFSLFLIYNYKPFLFDSKKNNNICRIINDFNVNLNSVSAQAWMARMLFLNLNSNIKIGSSIDDAEIKEALNKLTELKKSISILYEFAKKSNGYIEANFHNVVTYMRMYNARIHINSSLPQSEKD